MEPVELLVLVVPTLQCKHIYSFIMIFISMGSDALAEGEGDFFQYWIILILIHIGEGWAHIDWMVKEYGWEQKTVLLLQDHIVQIKVLLGSD